MFVSTAAFKRIFLRVGMMGRNLTDVKSILIFHQEVVVALIYCFYFHIAPLEMERFKKKRKEMSSAELCRRMLII